MKTGVEIDIFWSETESGFREPGAVHPHQDTYIMIFICIFHLDPAQYCAVLANIALLDAHDLTEQSAFATRAAFVLEFL